MEMDLARKIRDHSGFCDQLFLEHRRIGRLSNSQKHRAQVQFSIVIASQLLCIVLQTHSPEPISQLGDRALFVHYEWEALLCFLCLTNLSRFKSSFTYLLHKTLIIIHFVQLLSN